MVGIVVFINCDQTEKGTRVKRIMALLEQMSLNVSMDAEFYRFLKEKNGINPQHKSLIVDNNFYADVVLSIGGDGTFLRAAQRVGDKGFPILGINTGRLGFLADVPVNDIDKALEEIYKNNYSIEERSMLSLEISNFEGVYKSVALNEIAILKRDISSMITIRVEINESLLNNYEADGLVIATPTGSTAYSMSVGGPIIEPLSKNFVLSPVAPHSLTARPLVIREDSVLDVSVSSRTHSYLVAVDGKSYKLNEHQTLKIRKAPYKIKVIKRPGHTFYETLRDKLMWGADKRI